MATCPPFDFSAKYYNGGGSGCERRSSFFGDTTVLDQGVGYAVILGFGAFFAVFTSVLVSLRFPKPKYYFTKKNKILL